jgi:POT family proton-dependent oligopeptide transporter
MTDAHPPGLRTLFFTEMWERFSYYGMRAILVNFMAESTMNGGLGYDKSQQGAIYAIYTAAVYMMALPGGWVADKFLGQKRAVMVGGLIIMIGHILLALPFDGAFYGGLGCLVIGTGFLKPNVSTMVGQLYSKGDPRRDGGFSIFYMGINIGAFASPVICGWLAQSEDFKGFLADNGVDPHYSWHIAFGAAAIGMAFGLAQYWAGRAALDGIGEPPRDLPLAQRKTNLTILAAIIGALVAVPVLIWLVPSVFGVELSKELLSNIFGVLLLTIFVTTFVMLYLRAQTQKEKKGVLAMVALAIGCIGFFALFEQAGSVMNAFAEERTDTSIADGRFPAEWFQSVNSVFIMILSPLFAWFFTWVINKHFRFNDIWKFGVALVFMAIAFVVMLPAAGGVGVSPWFLVGFYFFSTVAELFLSPVGLSSMSKLAPPSAAGLVMGVWFLSTSNGDWLAGKAHALTETVPESDLFLIVIIGGLIVALLMFVLGHYFTFKVPLESLHQGKDDVLDETGAVSAVAPSQRIQVTGNGIAGFATSVALWPVALTEPLLGVVICAVLGPTVIILATFGLREVKRGRHLASPVTGNALVLATFPIALGALAYSLVKAL